MGAAHKKAKNGAVADTAPHFYVPPSPLRLERSDVSE
jgi:hypothetical protein